MRDRESLLFEVPADGPKAPTAGSKIAFDTSDSNVKTLLAAYVGNARKLIRPGDAVFGGASISSDGSVRAHFIHPWSSAFLQCSMRNVQTCVVRLEKKSM